MKSKDFHLRMIKFTMKNILNQHLVDLTFRAQYILMMNNIQKILKLKFGLEKQKVLLLCKQLLKRKRNAKKLLKNKMKKKKKKGKEKQKLL